MLPKRDDFMKKNMTRKNRRKYEYLLNIWLNICTEIYIVCVLFNQYASEMTEMVRK